MSPTRKSASGVRARAMSISAADGIEPADRRPAPGGGVRRQPRPAGDVEVPCAGADAELVEHQVVRRSRHRARTGRPTRSLGHPSRARPSIHVVAAAPCRRRSWRRRGVGHRSVLQDSTIGRANSNSTTDRAILSTDDARDRTCRHDEPEPTANGRGADPRHRRASGDDRGPRRTEHRQARRRHRGQQERRLRPLRLQGGPAAGHGRHRTRPVHRRRGDPGPRPRRDSTVSSPCASRSCAYVENRTLPGGCFFAAAAAELGGRPGPLQRARRGQPDGLDRACSPTAADEAVSRRPAPRRHRRGESSCSSSTPW